jgi:hypothetical protein
MKCPKCNQDFEWTWQRYIKAPWGRFPCPHCHTRLIGKHRRLYWLLLILFAVIILIPINIIHNHVYGIVCWIILILLVGLPFDKYLDNRFIELELDKKYSDMTEEPNHRTQI